MISEIKIQNFKSVKDATLKLGVVTVLIGENGGGKSNILESIAFLSGASSNKLGDEFLFLRGIRVVDKNLMKSAFPADQIDDDRGADIQISAKGDAGERVAYNISIDKGVDDKAPFVWTVEAPVDEKEVQKINENKRVRELVDQVLDELRQKVDLKELGDAMTEEMKHEFFKSIAEREFVKVVKSRRNKSDSIKLKLNDFLIYSPENSALRRFDSEGATKPLGIKGEGLLKLLHSFYEDGLADEYKGRASELSSKLKMFGWFNGIEPLNESCINQSRIFLKDRWLDSSFSSFDQRSANEGFLFVLFYLSLMMSWKTPDFFAIDNIDSTLNPKLCTALMREIIELAKKYNKQVVLTTHNPAILDGMDLGDASQRLYAVRRNIDGETEIIRIKPSNPLKGEVPVPLSVAFSSGSLGGLPNNF